jgi:hypothetical protein
MFQRIATLSATVLFAAGLLIASAPIVAAGEPVPATAALQVPASQTGTDDILVPAAVTEPCPLGTVGFGWG